MAFAAQHAGAVTLSPHGVGQALIYPYYTVNKNQDTLLSVTNASDVGKAIQVRFREGMNGRDTLSFVLFLGAHDTWTAAVTANGEAGARMKTNDRSCTLSPVPAEGQIFRTAAFDGTGTTPADGGPANAQRTREGFFEMIVGGDVKAGSATDIAIRTGPNHGAPTCAVDPHAFVGDLETSTAGIYGSASILDVGNGTYFAYNADALQGIADDVLFADGNPYPGPELNDATTSEGAAGKTRAHLTTTDGRGIALDYDSAIDAVSAVFMADAIYNDYVVSASLGAATDWVVTFPTKQFHVDSLYGAVPRAPFENAFGDPDMAPVDFTGTVFNRDGESVEFGSGCDGQLCQPVGLLYEVNVLSTSSNADYDPPPSSFESAVLGSTLDPSFLPTLGNGGYAQIRLGSADGGRVLRGGIDAQHGEEVTLSGLPVTGFMVYNIVNANASPGMLANYSAAFPHRRSVGCDAGTPGCAMHPDH